MRCKITNKKMIPFMSFGKMPIANGFISPADFKSEYSYIEGNIAGYNAVSVLYL